MKILVFLKPKCLKNFINLAVDENHEKRGGKRIITIPKVFLRFCEYHNFFIFNQL